MSKRTPNKPITNKRTTRTSTARKPTVYTVSTPTSRIVASALVTDQINAEIKTAVNNGWEVGQVSDGYHTFDELYEHRIELFVALCRTIYWAERGNHPKTGSRVWCSQVHSDGSRLEGWFVLGIRIRDQQITYHLPLSRWEECARFAQVLDRAPDYDGHTSADVLERLKRL